MKFKVLPGTLTYERLTALLDKMRNANKSAKTLAIELGAEAWTLAYGPFVISGGLSGLQMKEQPKGWRKVGGYKNVYFPSTRLKANQEVIKRIKELPIITCDELNEITGYEEEDIPSKGRGYIWSTHMGFNFNNGIYLLSLNENSNHKNTNPDIVEITMSEYKELTEAPEESEATND